MLKYLKVYTDFAEETEELTDVEMGRLIRAMLIYARSGEQPELHGNERYMWKRAKMQIDAQSGAYENVCAINKRIANERSVTERDGASRSVTERDKTKTNINQDTKEKPPKGGKEKGKPFSRPTVEDITGYCREAGIEIDADAFIDFYSSKGWKVGDASMKDWKAAVRNWARRDAERRPAAKKGMGANAPYKQTQLSEAELDALLIDLDQEIV